MGALTKRESVNAKVNQHGYKSAPRVGLQILLFCVSTAIAHEEILVIVLTSVKGVLE